MGIFGFADGWLVNPPLQIVFMDFFRWVGAGLLGFLVLPMVGWLTRPYISYFVFCSFPSLPLLLSFLASLLPTPS